MLTSDFIKNISERFVHLRQFVDRTEETSEFQSLVDKRYEERDIYKRIIAFYGPPGIGKTLLLDRLEFECVRLNVPYTRIDFEKGLYNDTLKILREMVRELDPKGFQEWNDLDRKWRTPEVNFNLQGQGGGYNISGENVSNVNFSAGRDMVAGSKMELNNSTINIGNLGDNLSAAEGALTESFIVELAKFVQERPAVILFEGLDHELCSVKTRQWVYDLLDHIRVLTGYGVLPVVTFYNPPNFELRLSDVTLCSPLDPLEEENIIEYFRIREIPDSILVDAARLCVEETDGIPARVYAYTQNIIHEIQKQRKKAKPSTKAPETPAIVPEKIVETVPVAEQAAALPTEPIEPARETIPVETPVPEMTVVIEPIENIVSETPVMEIQDMAQVIEPVAVIVTESIITEPAPVHDEPTSSIQEEQPETSEINQPVEEHGSSDTQTGTSEELKPEGIEQSESFEPVPQAGDEMRDEPDLETVEAHQEIPLTENIPTSMQEESKEEELQQEEETRPVAEIVVDASPASEQDSTIDLLVMDSVQPVEETKAESAPVELSPVAEDVIGSEAEETKVDEVQPTADQAEEALRLTKERLKQLKSEGKSLTANMIDSLLEQQSADVADIAQRCAVLTRFSLDMIAVVAGRDLTLEQATEILDTILSWPFVQKSEHGTYTYRSEIQQYLRTQMQTNDPQLYREINQLALTYFEKQLGSIDFSDELIWVNLQAAQINLLREMVFYLLQTDFTRGFELFGKLLQSAQRLNIVGEAATLLKFMGGIDRSLLNQSQINQLSYFEAVQNIAEGDMPSAKDKLDALVKNSIGDELMAQVLSQLGRIAAAAGGLDDAIKYTERAQKIWQALKRERERAKLSNNLGNFYRRKGDLDRAERSFNDALKGLSKTGTLSEQSQTLNNLGIAYMEKENLSKALDHYQKSLDIKKNIGDQFGSANTYTNVGTVYQKMAQEASGKKQVEYRQQAADYYMRSLEIYRTFGARSNQGKLLFKLAYFYYQTQDKVKAKEYLPDALALFEELGMPDLENARKLEKQLG